MPMEQLRMTECNDYAAVREWALRYIEDHPEPDFFIGRPGDHQLQRWFVVPRNTESNVYLHRFLRSDEDRALHDHPWANKSWVLAGEYLEVMRDQSVTRREGEMTMWRPAALAHRVELVTGPVVTLFFTGPVIREWGFHCGGSVGWRHWKDFVEEIPGGNHIGRGCE